MKFKVGDWVREKMGGRILQVEAIEGTVLILKDNSLYVKACKWEKWEPKEGEWVWFYDRVVKIVEINEYGYVRALNPLQTEQYDFYLFNECEPYIVGVEPSFMRTDYNKRGE